MKEGSRSWDLFIFGLNIKEFSNDDDDGDDDGGEEEDEKVDDDGDNEDGDDTYVLIQPVQGKRCPDALLACPRHLHVVSSPLP